MLDDLPTSIAAPKELRRRPILDDEGNPVEVLRPGDVTRHVSITHVDPIARTLAAVSPKRLGALHAPQAGPVYRVKSFDGGWEVVDREGRRLCEPQRAQSDAVIHAKELARRDGSAQIIVHADDGSIASEFFYQRDERSALSSDDSPATFAATRPAHALGRTPHSR